MQTGPGRATPLAFSDGRTSKHRANTMLQTYPCSSIHRTVLLQPTERSECKTTCATAPYCFRNRPPAGSHKNNRASRMLSHGRLEMGPGAHTA